MSKSTSPDDDVKAVIAAERQWADVVTNRDRSRAEAILADEFMLTGPEAGRVSTGRVTTKDVWLANLPNVEVKRFDMLNPVVNVHGNTAVVTMSATLDWAIAGKKLPSDYLLTDVWVKRSNGWQVLLRVSEPK